MADLVPAPLASMHIFPSIDFIHSGNSSCSKGQRSLKSYIMCLMEVEGTSSSNAGFEVTTCFSL